MARGMLSQGGDHVIKTVGRCYTWYLVSHDSVRLESESAAVCVSFH